MRHAMDIDQQRDTPTQESGHQIILPGDVLPDIIHVIPQENRPFFPGQALPLLMNAEIWLPT